MNRRLLLAAFACLAGMAALLQGPPASHRALAQASQSRVVLFEIHDST